jgi:hypothetical protein
MQVVDMFDITGRNIFITDGVYRFQKPGCFRQEALQGWINIVFLYFQFKVLLALGVIVPTFFGSILRMFCVT